VHRSLQMTGMVGLRQHSAKISLYPGPLIAYLYREFYSSPKLLLNSHFGLEMSA